VSFYGFETLIILHGNRDKPCFVRPSLSKQSSQTAIVCPGLKIAPCMFQVCYFTLLADANMTLSQPIVQPLMVPLRCPWHPAHTRTNGMFAVFTNTDLDTWPFSSSDSTSSSSNRPLVIVCKLKNPGPPGLNTSAALTSAQRQASPVFLLRPSRSPRCHNASNLHGPMQLPKPKASSVIPYCVCRLLTIHPRISEAVAMPSTGFGSYHLRTKRKAIQLVGIKQWFCVRIRPYKVRKVFNV
jgi:hypothetical protein